MKKVVPFLSNYGLIVSVNNKQKKKSYHYNAKQAIANGGASFFL
ncbi:hypothetical protein ABQE10_03185 [Enterococcus avium]